MSRIHLTQGKFYKLAEWLKKEHKANRLEGQERQQVAARATLDLGFAVAERNIKLAAEAVGIAWSYKRTRKVPTATNTMSVAADLRQLSQAVLELMEELGTDKAKPLYQSVLKLAAAGGLREVKKAA